jgi:hypothetical protein
MRENFDLLRKVYGPYYERCDDCKEFKHKLKFKRFNSYYHVCNDCFNGRGKENED